MKILKKAKQKNVIVNKDYYSLNEINEMLDNHIICYFNEKYEDCYYYVTEWEMKNLTFRMFTEELKEIKVVLDEGYYTTVAITKNNEKVYIEL